MTFIFKNYGYDKSAKTAWFEYAHSNGHEYREEIQFNDADDTYNQVVFDQALFLSFLLVGTSYYKCFPSREVVFEVGGIDEWQANFLNHVYQEGMSQFAFENHLNRQDMAHFVANDNREHAAIPTYTGNGVLSLQSGGKDSLLVAKLLEKNGVGYDAWYISNGPAYPELLNNLSADLRLAHRQIDIEAIKRTVEAGGKNGHVPVTYIVLSYALLQAVLLNKRTILAAIAHEGDEPHAWIDDLPVNHQWSKTWQAEQLFAEYVSRYIATQIKVGSPLRHISELKLTELFSRYAWPQFGTSFSSCNLGNYKQHTDNSQLTWCGECPKCANAYLLFAPFIDKSELDRRLGGDLLAKPVLTTTFKGLLGIEGVMKPFECVGEVDELRLAYALALRRGYSVLPFDVPSSSFDYEATYPSQESLTAMISW